MSVKGISPVTSWNPKSRNVAIGSSAIGLGVLVTGVALTVLKLYGNTPLILLSSGGAFLGSAITYGLILKIKQSRPSENIPAKECAPALPEKVLLDQLENDQLETLINTILTETKEDRQQAIDQLSSG